MKVNAADTFFKSLKKIINSEKWWHWRFWRTKYYELKDAIWALRKYFKVVTKMVPWDYHSMMVMMAHQAKILSYYLENYGIEVDETRIPKVKKLKRFVELLDNYLADNDAENTYAERCGYNFNAEDINWVPSKDKKGNELYEMKSIKKKGYEHVNNYEAIRKGHELEEKEWNEMMDILKNEMRCWWD